MNTKDQLIEEQDTEQVTEREGVRDVPAEPTSNETKSISRKAQRSMSAKKLRPIILLISLVLFWGVSSLSAQFEGSVSLGTRYSDNVFQLSENDLDDFNADEPDMDFVKTSDDLTLMTNVDLGYSFYYKWWKITPSVSATVTQNVSNKEKYRRDGLVRLRLDRYYWNFTALYGYYPRTYLRDYVDTDGTDELEQFSYARDLYRADLNLRPFKNSSLRLHARHEIYRYNEYFTEFDSKATTYGIGWRQNFPYFGLEAGYNYRVLDNENNVTEPLDDSSYESNEYSGLILLKKMPLDDSKPKGVTWQPSLELSYEERFFQGMNEWYGGRTDQIYTTRASINIELSKAWNINLDYSHDFRNIDSPNSAVRRAKEYGENRLGAFVKYEF